jgi:hypothetical protein
MTTPFACSSATRTLLALVAAGVLVGCQTPYRRPVVEYNESFDGLLDHAGRGDLRVVTVHGMCDHDIDWVNESLEVWSSALGVVPAPVAKETDTIAGVKRYEALVEADSGTIAFEFIVWSPLTSRIKDTLHDSTAPQYKRARLNGALKDVLLNRCLADAIVYTGAAGTPLKEATRAVVCNALTGEMDGQGRCIVPDDTSPLVFITESLGSAVLFDAISALHASAGGDSDSFEAAVGNTYAVYMLANQVPLLALAEMNDPGTGVQEAQAETALDTFVSIVESARSAGGVFEADQSALEVVAFSDPNDLLSYRVSPSLERSEPEVRVVNVTVSNSATLFGFVERPDLAHTTYDRNEGVTELLLHGTER